MPDDVAISVSAVSKNFILPHERSSSIKGTFTSIHRRGGKTKEIQHALHDINFEVKKGEFFGIVGRNGSGKSTLLKILAGIYQPTHGKVHVSGRLVPFIELGVGFNPELSGRENVYLNGAMLGFSEKEVETMYDDIVAFAELERFMDQKLKNYSSGMQVRLAFSLATRAHADVLLVDEVLAVGDADFQRKCFSYFKQLKADKKTVVFVTHDMNAVREYCDRAMLIDDSRVQKIGAAPEIAREYALLFMDSSTSRTQKGSGERWGNGDATVQAIDIKVGAQEILIDLDIAIQKPVGRLIYGLHIMGEDGIEITAMNNRMIQKPDVTDLKSGDTVKIQWKVQNVFNDGTYTAMVTLVDDMANTLDWIVQAGSFEVRRADRSTTAVLPPVEVSYSVKK